MSARYTLGVDFGGTSSKATLLREDGVVAAVARRDYPTHSPRPGWAEQAPEDWLAALRENLAALWHTSGVSPEEIACVAVDAATHMAVLLDGDDRPLRPVIHWSDSRSAAQAASLRAEHGDLLRERSVNTPGSAWTLPQLLWLREHEPALFPRLCRVTFAKDYIRGRLTGDRRTDAIEAMGAMLGDDRTGRWDPQLCALAGLEAQMLPEICDPGDTAGTVTQAAARETGLRPGTPVAVGTTDTALEVFACGANAEGMATVKLATAGRICPITRGPVPSRQFFNYRHLISGLWYPGTGTRSCATSYRWFRDTLGGGSDYGALDALAAAVPPGSQGLLFHPYLLGELTPYYDDALRGGFTGAAMHHTKGHFARAVLEGVAFSLRDCMEEIRANSLPVRELRLLGGGAKSPLWRQIVADVLDTPLVCTEENDSSLGSAMLAAVTAGFFDSYAECASACVRVSGRAEPNAANREVYRQAFSAYRAVTAALRPVYQGRQPCM